MSVKKSAKHHPGPWTVDEKALRGWEYRITAIDDPQSNTPITIADIPNPLNLMSWDEVAKANAVLIAAAPEMLVVLRGIKAMTQKYKDDPKAALEMIRNGAAAAIAKAEGGENVG